MDRKWKSGASVTPPLATDNASDGYATAGNPGTGTPATKPGPYWYHQITEELLAILAAAGVTPDKTVLTQLRDAITGAALPFNGIKFPATQVANAGANVLDDYEEGSWTPTIGGSSGGAGQTYATQTGSYIKIGRVVLVNFKVILTAKGTITGVPIIGGLPFASVTEGAGALRWDAMAASQYFVGYYHSSPTYLNLKCVPSASTSLGDMGPSDIGNTTAFTGSTVYLAAN